MSRAGSPPPTVLHVYIDGTPEDGERLRPLAAELRGRELDVDFQDDGLLAAGERIDLARERVRLGHVVVLPTGSLARALGRVDMLRHSLQTSPARIVGVRLSPADPEPEPTVHETLNLMTFGDLRSAAGRIEELVRGTATGETPPSPSQERAPVREGLGPVRLRFGESSEIEEWTVAPALAGALLHAGRFGREHGEAPRFALSFRSLLLSLFNTAGPWSLWIRDTGASTGFRAERIFEEAGLSRAEVAERARQPLTAAELGAIVTATTSASRILRAARKHAAEASAKLDVEHVLAALIHDPAGHVSDLAAYGFDSAAWSAALTRFVADRLPGQAEYFDRLHRERFPDASAAQASSASSASSEQDPRRPSKVLDSWSASFWQSAHEDLKDALALAAALATSGGSTAELSPLHLLGGILGRAADDPLPEAWSAAVPRSPEHASLAAPQLALASLGLATEGSERRPLEALPELAPESRRVLEAAGRRRSRGTTPMDVFVELWMPQEPAPAAIDAVLAARGLDPEEILRALCQDTRLGLGAHALRGALDRRVALAWSRPAIGNDRVGETVPLERDRLDVGPAAKRLAKLLADTSVAPPLAVGLFGNWGSGKTFFMGLMRSHVKELMQSRAPGYARRIVQIEFNAWHYHDTNLWASLAVHIFDRLAHELSEKTPSKVEEVRRELHEKMRSSKAHRQEAQAQRERALEARAVAARELEEKRHAREEIVRKSVSRRLEIAWAAVRTQPSFARLRESSAEIAEQFGLTRVAESRAEVEALRAEIEKTRAHGFGLFTAIGHRFQDGNRRVRTVAALVGVLLLALALGWGTERFFEQLRTIAPRYSGTVVEVATMLSVVVAWCGRRVRQLQTGLDRIGALEADLRAAEAQVDARADGELFALQEQIARLDKEISDADGKIAAADQEIAQAQAEIDRINRGGLVYDFLQQRRTDAAYVGQLGLISTIRRDLGDLDVLLEDFARNAKDDAPAIERILLYIDDLDRCHPDKVLEVLQAVHLLLTFDLFNVVVGVDARWLERSLRRQYEQKLGGRMLVGDGFSPQDYLEKIFQIPFALGGMDSNGYRRFVGDMIPTRTLWLERKAKEDARRREEEEEERRRREEEARPVAERAADAPRTLVEGGAASEQTPASPSEPHVAGGHVDAPAEANGGARPERGPERAAEVPQYIEEHEAEFIARLHPFIDRPRLAKRFVNIYKLLRVTADDEAEGAEFAREADSEAYRAVLVLLAIHIGHHRVSIPLVQALSTAGANDTLSDVLARLGTAPGGRARKEELQELAQVRAKLARLTGVAVPERLEAYQKWGPHVLRYSFEPLPPSPAHATAARAHVRIEGPAR